jgi:hypothetical protein
MKFVLSSAKSYPWPVTVRIPDPANPGSFVEQTFTARLIPQDQDAWIADQAAVDAIEPFGARMKASRAKLAARIEGWGEDVVDDAGNPVPFTPENLDRALRQSWFRIGVLEAIQASANGEEARLGN